MRSTRKFLRLSKNLRDEVMHHINRQHHDEKNLYISAVFMQRQKHQKIVKKGVFGGSEKRAIFGSFWGSVYTGECGRNGPPLMGTRPRENRPKS